MPVRQSCLWLRLIVTALIAPANAAVGAYHGRWCEGQGDPEYLALIDRSFGFFHANPDTQWIGMLYEPKWECLLEGQGWGMWWSQNSYGPTLAALPFLDEPWRTMLQHSQDFWFATQGDGVRKDGRGLTVPDGCLSDCANPDQVIHVQGDLTSLYPGIADWSFGFTAADVVMQAELLLIDRDPAAIRRYLPNLERACAFVETRRDAETGLFLVGPAADLLAPAYGAVKRPDGSAAPAFLAELSVHQFAALERMAELYKLLGDAESKAKLAKTEALLARSRAALARLQTPEGYLIRFLEAGPGGIAHGAPGLPPFDQIGTTANVDAVAHHAVDAAASPRIVDWLLGIPELRPHAFLLPNWPSLADSCEQWGTPQSAELMRFGRWVNGGVWLTLEARALLAYARAGRTDAVLRSGRTFMGMAQLYQLDAPISDFGAAPWNGFGITMCYDSLGVPAAIARGLFESRYSAEGVTLYPHLPRGITYYQQKQPIRLGARKLLLEVEGSGPEIQSVAIAGQPRALEAADRVLVRAAELPEGSAEVSIKLVMGGDWPPARAGAEDPPMDGAALRAAVQASVETTATAPTSLGKSLALLARAPEPPASGGGAIGSAPDDLATSVTRWRSAAERLAGPGAPVAVAASDAAASTTPAELTGDLPELNELERGWLRELADAIGSALVCRERAKAESFEGIPRATLTGMAGMQLAAARALEDGWHRRIARYESSPDPRERAVARRYRALRSLWN